MTRTRSCAPSWRLVSIDRSLTALERLRASFDEMPLQELQGMLNHLRAGLETKVPGARAYVRLGLDRPGAARERL